jgi:apolipoprotein N-acyltransferase
MHASESSWKWWAAAGLSAVLLELPFPIAGPMPPWRSVFAWIALIPLLWALLSIPGSDCRHPLRRAFLIAFFCGVLWYIGNCYWIRDTMLRYGDMPPFAPTLLLVGFSLVLGLYFGIFGFGVLLVRQATGSTRLALASAPILWAGLELAAARITSVPWDQLGYSQVDNAFVNQLAPWTGVYGISFVLVAANAFLTGAFHIDHKSGSWALGRWVWTGCGAILLISGFCGVFIPASKPDPTATAVLVQPNLDVGTGNMWQGEEWDRHIADFEKLGAEQCKAYIAGIPQTGAPTGEIVCPPYATHPDVVVWPEAPAPFYEQDPRFLKAMAEVAHADQAPLIVNGIGSDFSRDQGQWLDHVSAMIFRADGQEIGRYDKIHLVPFGEYVPFSKVLFFAHKLTGRVGLYTPGVERNVFLLDTQNGGSHRYGVFICYEAVFADEVRQFARHGAEVFVNISDDGWYGDTSAPWQHLNMTRMRAIENRRWILRDTNTGVTAVIDPYGSVRQSIPRHEEDALPAEFGFRDDMTFYAAHGDVFAWVCAILALGVAGVSLPRGLRPKTKNEDRS